ncbi:MAG: hypothetical protein UHW60_00050, partial [Methanobrevibacter sp.]|nr:hypothetical protein [Methanobrevibacter sp.]
MNIKINTICFIILLFLLIGVASAADSDNETFTQPIEQPDDEICLMSSDDQDELKASNEDSQKLEKSDSDDKLGAKSSTKKIESKSSKKAIYVLTEARTKTTLKVSNVKMHYKDGSKLVVTLKDKNKKTISKAKIKIYVFGK